MTRRRVRGQQGLAAVLAALLLAAVSAGIVLAHASLVRSNPAPNTRFEQSPAGVTVWFDEPIEPEYAHLSVYDAGGQRVDRLDSRYSPGEEPSITATLPNLPTGSYVVVWRVISVDDGHPVGGAFAFGVRASPDPGAAVAAGAQADAQPDLTSHLIRFLDLIGQMLLFGAVVFQGLVWRPVLLTALRAGQLSGLGEIETEERRWLQVLADILVGVLIIGLLGSLYVQARSTGVLFWQLLATRWGVIWLVRAALVLLASLWMESLLDGRRAAWAWGLGLALLTTTALTSHSVATAGVLGAAADLLHEVSAAVWVGGVLLLALTLLALRGSPLPQGLRGQLGAAAVSRFSGLAALGVGVLLSTGLLLGWQQVQTWSGLLLTDYGRTLSLKLLLVVVALGFGAYNSLSVRGRAVDSNGRSPAWIALEALLTIAVIFAAAVMTELPPASAAGTAGAAVAAVGDAPLSLPTATSDGWTFQMRLTPARIGSNVFEGMMTIPAGLISQLGSARLYFTPDDGGAQTILDLSQTKPGLFTGTGGALNKPGIWHIDLTVLLSPATSGAGLETAHFTVEAAVDGIVRAAGTPLPWNVSLVIWLNQYGRVALAVLLAAGAGAWSWIASRTRHGLARAGWLAAGLLAALVLVMTVVFAG